MLKNAYIIAALLLSVLILVCFAQNVKFVINNKGGSMKYFNRDQLNKEQEKLNRLMNWAQVKKNMSKYRIILMPADYCKSLGLISFLSG